MSNHVHAVVRPGEQAAYVAECVELPVVTQGATLDNTMHNLQEAVELYLEDEDLQSLGLTKMPTIVVTMELEAQVA